MFTKTNLRTIRKSATLRKENAAKRFADMTTPELIHHYRAATSTGQRNAWDVLDTLRKRGVVL